MNEFALTYELRPGYLFVKGMGMRKDLAAILESTKVLTGILEETKSRFVLLDYAELETVISNHDIFNVTRLYETKAPVLFDLCISIIINPTEVLMEKFWEEICLKRGFNFKIFTQAKEAEAWLLSQVAKG